MINQVPYNFYKPNEYKYYHIRILDNQNVVTTLFDLSLDVVKKEIEKYKNNYNFTVIGTTDNIDTFIYYINRKNSDIIGYNLKKEDIFTYKHDFLVNCTEYFKNN